MKLHRPRSVLRRVGHDQRGASVAEYAMLIGLIGLLAFVGFRRFGSNLLGVGDGQAKTVLCIPDGNGEIPPGCQSSAGSGPLAYNGPTECTGDFCVNGNCFVAGTPVATEAGSLPIEEVRVGDFVLARDERTGEVAPNRVTRTFITPNMPVVDLRIRETPDDVIRATPGHRFWTADRGWVAAEQLTPGEELSDATGTHVHVEALTADVAAETVFNFEVEETHTYFVGAARVWVHNPTAAPCAGSGGAGGGGGSGGGAAPPPPPIVAVTPPPGGAPPVSTVFHSGPLPVSWYTPGSASVFRGDGRGPLPDPTTGAPGIFDTGLAPWKQDGTMELLPYASGDTPRLAQYVSTSTCEGVGVQFCQDYNKDWVYEIQPPPGGVDVNATLGPDSPFPHEQEVAYPGGVPKDCIVGAQQVDPATGAKVGSLVPNPNYNPAACP